MGVLLILLAFVAVAYLLTHFVVDRLQRRFLFASGLEYILLGVLLGPNLHVLTDLDSLAPVIAFGAGWIGLLYGMEVELPVGRRASSAEAGRTMRLAGVESAITGCGVAAAAAAVFRSGAFVGEISSDEAWLSAAVMGCAAAAGSSSAVDLLLSRYHEVATRLLPLLRRTARLGDILAIAAFGVLMCRFHHGDAALENPPDPSTWVLLTAGLGLSLGALFVVFLGDDDSENSRFLALVGIISFASGAAFFLDLSALTVNLLLGVVLVHSRHGEAIHSTLAGTQKPASLILLVFAGVLWTPVPALPAIALSVGFIVLRFVCKALGCWIASMGTSLRDDLVRGLLAQGHVALAIALMFRLVYSGPAVDLAYTAILASVVFYELIAPRVLKGLLIDAGDLRHDVPQLEARA